MLTLLLATAVPILAQDTVRVVTDDEVNEIAKEVYCPVCESTPLDVCETQACADWRELIRSKLASGQTKEEVFAYFAEQYGDRVLASPPPRGLNLLLWIWPFVAFIGGGAIFVRYIHNIRQTAVTQSNSKPTAVTTPPPTAPLPDSYISRIEQELKGE
jgi:cytochrome c-type biogenesis protein CcmH